MSPRLRSGLDRGIRPVALGALAIVVATLGSGASEGREPISARRTVVVVPGLTGTELVDSETGEMVWGRGANLFSPDDGGYGLVVPLGNGPDRLRPAATIDRVRFGPLSKPIYGPLANRLERGGWVRGDLQQPRPGENLFFYAYDWRRDNSRVATDLGHHLERLAAKRTGTLPVTLICQSNGAHLCRYLVKYGVASLEEAEAGRSRSLRRVAIEQVILVAAANGGSIRTLRQFNTSRRYLAAVGRLFQPEVMFTFESIYQGLPSYTADLFVDSMGKSVQIDIFDVATWERFGWSVFDPTVAARIQERPDLFGSIDDRRSFLARSLDRARRFKDLLRRDHDIGGVAYYTLQNDALPTQERAVVRQGASGWETLFAEDRATRRLAIAASLFAPGDGHAPISSQRSLTPKEIAAFAAPPRSIDAKHFQMIVKDEALDYVLEICSRPRLARMPVIEAGARQ